MLRLAEGEDDVEKLALEPGLAVPDTVGLDAETVLLVSWLASGSIRLGLWQETGTGGAEMPSNIWRLWGDVKLVLMDVH